MDKHNEGESHSNDNMSANEHKMNDEPRTLGEISRHEQCDGTLLINLNIK